MELYVQEPDQDLTSVHSQIMDGKICLFVCLFVCCCLSCLLVCLLVLLLFVVFACFVVACLVWFRSFLLGKQRTIGFCYPFKSKIQEMKEDINPLLRQGRFLSFRVGYFSHLTSLNNLLTMAQQLHADVQTCASHKYIAHQIALIYVSSSWAVVSPSVRVGVCIHVPG